MYSHQNSITVKEELAQLIDMFRMLVEIHEEQEEIDKEYDDEIWFDDLDQKILSFKHKVHNWLKEGEKLRKSDQVSRCSLKSSSKYSSKSSAKLSSLSKLRTFENEGKSNCRENQSCRTYDGSFLYKKKERYRVSDWVPYGGGRISQSSRKSRNL